MCGLVGVIELGGRTLDYKILTQMSDTLYHRGPDDKKWEIKQPLGFAHSRLKIIDLSDKSSQPMLSSCGGYMMVYNGEVYNFKDIRKDLQKKGYKFQTSGDTEVVLYALVEWREKALTKFNGMFAFGFWDLKQRTLLLGRDRYGIKPLYYTITRKFIIFASEQRAILEHPEFNKKLNKEALVEYLTFQNIFTNQTLVENIKILEPGHSICLKLSKDYCLNSFSINQYWDFDFNSLTDHSIKEKDAKELLSETLDKAIKRNLIADVEVGSYLSGGIDSSLIVAKANKLGNALKTFTCGFDMSSVSGLELAFDERALASSIAKRFSAQHYEFLIKAGDMNRALNAVTKHLEEPRVGQSYPNYYAARLARSHVKVVLSGAGGDELFAGYPWRYYRSIQHKSFDNYVNDYYNYWNRMLTKTELDQITLPIASITKNVDTRSIFKNIYKNTQKDSSNIEDSINLSLYLEAKTFLHGLLVVEDKLSSAFGLESRVPYLDNEVVDLAMKIPLQYKLKSLNSVSRLSEDDLISKRAFFLKSSDGKEILRKVAFDVLGSKVSKGIKQGFSAPDATWFRGQSVNFLNNLLVENNSPLHEILDKKTMVNLISEHSSGKKNRRLLMWSLLNLHQYLSDF